MPEEILILSVMSIVFGTGLIIFVSSLLYRAWRVKSEATNTGKSLTTSQIEAMMRRVVAEGLEPIEERLDLLLPDSPTALPAASLRADENDLLDAAEGYELGEEAVRAGNPRVRRGA